MALPVITNNSPAAGSIAWSAFGITYNGTQYPVAAGNTDKAFVYWAYNGGSPLLVTTNTLPASLAPEDYFLFLNKTGIGMLVDAAQVTDGSMIVSGSIYAAAIAANQINSNHIVSDAITATHIGAGVIEAEHIGAGVITAEKLSVGTVSDNMIVNGSFEDIAGTPAFPVGWEKSAETNGTIAPVTGVSSSGATSVRFDATATTSNLRLRQKSAQFIPVSAASGRKYYVSARMGVSVATTQGNWLRANWYDAAKQLISTSDVRSNAALTTTFTLYEGQVTPPATARYLGIEVLFYLPNVVSQLFLDEVTAHEVTMAAQIGDGQITAAKILAGTITSDRISASGITADKLLVSDFTNWFSNPGFNQGTSFLDNWNTGAGVAFASTEFASGRALQNTATGSYLSRYQMKSFPVQEGDKFYLSATVHSTTGTLAPTARVLVKDAANANILNAGTSTTSTDGAYVKGRYTVVTVPAGARLMQLWIEMHNPGGGTQTIGDLVCRRMNGGELVVDGSIVASKIATDAVEADKIAANAVTAGKIAANAIEAGHISANAVTADKILAGEIGTNHLAANAITADKIDADAINGMTITGVTITGGELRTAGDPTTTVYARMGQTAVSNTSATDRPGFGFEKPDQTIPVKIGMFSEDAETLALIGGRASGSGPADSYITLNKDKIDVYNSDEISFSTDGFRTWASFNVDTQYVNLNPDKAFKVQGLSRSKAQSDYNRDNIVAPTPTDGDTIIRTDLGGIVQRRIDSKWSGFAGSVAYVATQNGYNNYARGYPTTHAYMGPDGRTYLGGMFGITSTGAVAIQGGVFYTMGTLPAGYRPPYPVQFNPAAAHDLGPCNLYVATDGTIQYRLAAAKNLANGYQQFFLSLEGISWRNTNC